MGLQGYSTPSTVMVVFSVRHQLLPAFRRWLVQLGEVGETVVLGEGSYHRVRETCFVAPEAVFDFLRFSRPVFFSREESFLYLGTPQARNWRPATLKYTNGRPDEPLGTWHEVNKEDVGRRDYTCIRSSTAAHYFVCEKNPPTSEADKQDRVRMNLELLGLRRLEGEHLSEKDAHTIAKALNGRTDMSGTRWVAQNAAFGSLHKLFTGSSRRIGNSAWCLAEEE